MISPLKILRDALFRRSFRQMVGKINVAGVALLAAGLFVGSPDRLEAGETAYRCDPALPVFCGNTHVGCAGKTTIPTVSFDLTAGGSTVDIDFDDGTHIRQLPVKYGNGGTIRFANGDWIHIGADLHYSHRIYRKGRAAMSHGVCRFASALPALTHVEIVAEENQRAADEYVPQ